MLSSKQVTDKLSNPEKLFFYKELDFINNPPKKQGIYAFYFDQLPYPDIKGIEDCKKVRGWILMYIGISPKKRTSNGNISNENINKRIGSHFGKVIAEWSTLRESLGNLLSKSRGLDIKLKLINTRKNFGPIGEQKLTEWMKEHARVCWFVIEKPWVIEKEVIRALNVPLNLKHNESHPFYHTLLGIRKEYRNEAKREAEAIQKGEIREEHTKPKEEQLPSNIEEGVEGKKEYGKRKLLYTVDENDGILFVLVHTKNVSFINCIKTHMNNPVQFYSLCEPDRERYERFKQSGYRSADQINSMAQSYFGVIVLIDYPLYFKNGNVKFKFHPKQ